MKILHVDSGREWRGGQAQVLLLLSGLRDRGHEQILCSPGGSPLCEKIRAAGGIDIQPLGIQGDLDARAWLRLSRIVRRFRPEVLHAHTAHAHAIGVAAGRLAGVPARIVTRRTGLGVARNAFSRTKYLSGVSRYIAISRHVADTLAEGGVDPNRISVVYSGVPPQVRAEGSFSRAREEARRGLGLPAAGPVVALVGALTGEKGHDLALAMLSRMRVAAHLVFLGEGPLRTRLESRAGRLGLNNRALFAGFRPDLAALWPAFDLLVAPSRHEGLGTSVIEALGAGVPVLASSAGGLVEVIDNGRGGLVLASEDPESWARKVDELLGSDTELKRLGEAGRARAEDFTPERMILGTEEVYVNVFPGRARSGGRGSLEVGP
jgi:glycosyltransferase involved in cell wall biosynthesis